MTVKDTRFTSLKVQYESGRGGDFDGQFRFADPQTISMGDAQVALTVVNAASATQLQSNILYVDAESSGTEDLLLPPEADCNGMLLLIANTGGESIVVKEDGDSTTICTIETTEDGIVFCNGTAWSGGTIPSVSEAGYLSGITPGTVTASKAVVVDGSKDIADFGTVGVGTLTGATLILESLNPMTIKLNDTDGLQIDNAAISGFSAAADTAGNSVYIETEDGGATPTGSKAGGLVNIKTGDGSSALTTVAAGPGGAVTLASGAGGVQSGAGASGVGGAGGAIAVTGGVGGITNNTGTDAAGAGGAVAVVAGAGGAASGAGASDGGAGGDITLTPGAGGTSANGLAGLPGAVKVAAGAFFEQVQTIDMGDATVQLAITPTASHTTLTGNILFVDANSGATEVLELPPEAASDGLHLKIINTGGETINLKTDAAADPSPGAVAVLTAESADCYCDGTTWFCYNYG